MVSDYIHPTPRDGRCRIRIYLPKDEWDAPVVLCLELPNNNEGSSITYSSTPASRRGHPLPQARRAARVDRALPPKEATDGHSETFELVVFSSYEVKERAPYLGETRLTVGEPTWKTLDRESVEALVEQAVESVRPLATEELSHPPTLGVWGEGNVP